MAEISLRVDGSLINILIQEPTMGERLNCTRFILLQDEVWTIGDKDYDRKSSYLNQKEITILVFSSIPYNQSNPSKTQLILQKTKQLRSKLGWIPMNIIEALLKNTTLLAKNQIKLPPEKHYKSRFHQLNRNRLHERYSTKQFLVLEKISHVIKYLLKKKVNTLRQ